MDHRRPHELSGGQQQRVALARALALGPRLLPLDEPFNRLNAGLRETTCQAVRTLLGCAGITSVLVTHDQEEALSFADTQGVMYEGHLDQIGTPCEVYALPRTVFVARVLRRADILVAEARGESAVTPLGTVQLSQKATGTVVVALHPEALAIVLGGDWTLCGRDYRGHHVLFRLERQGQELRVRADTTCPDAEGTQVGIVARGQGVLLEDEPPVAPKHQTT